MKTRTKGINIVRIKYVLNAKDERVPKKEYLRCRVNAAVPDSHMMLAFERQLLNEM